jgi:lipoprotein-releasing system permease protein
VVDGKALLLHDGRAGDVNKVVIVRGVDPERTDAVTDIKDRTAFGVFEFGRRDGHPGVVVGLDLAERLALLPEESSSGGSEVSLLSAPELERAISTIWGPSAPKFAVRGVYDRAAASDESTVYVHIDDARTLFRMRGRASSIDIRLDDIDRAGEVKRALITQLPAARYRVRTWYDLQRSLYDVMMLEKWASSVILALIILVAAFNIVGSLTMVVIEKRRDVGVLQAMGVSRRNIRRIFLNQGLLIGLIGTAVGLTFGLGLAVLQDAYQLVPIARSESFLIDAYPVSIQWFDILVIGAIAVGLCVLASLYPAGRAAAVEPATAVAMDA